MGALQLRHRLGAFRDAAGTVTHPAVFVVRELPFLALRPVVALISRGTSRTPGEIWDRIGRILPAVGRYRLRESGQTVFVRHGTPDVFTLAEVIGRPTYHLPAEGEQALSRAGTSPRVVDIGANIGTFSKATLSKMPGARIRAVEPDPYNLRILRKNGRESASGPWEIVAACAATRDGRMEFLPGRFAESRAPGQAEPAAASSLPAVDIFPLLADADMVKIDIEGGEWAILEDARFAEIPARAVVLEYHRWLCPQPEQPGDYAVKLLERAGFVVGPRSEDAPGFGVVSGWRRP